MKYAVINGVRYRVHFGDKFTTFHEIGSRKIRGFKSSMSVKEVVRILSAGR